MLWISQTLRYSWKKTNILSSLQAQISNVPDDIIIRINKAIPSLSRRKADEAIDNGRVTVNDILATKGTKVARSDRIFLDGQLIDNRRCFSDADDVYIKMWKPKGVECTTDRDIIGNIIDAGRFDSKLSSRVFPVGRLDKDSTGLILLTSDGDFCQQLLGKSSEIVKKYVVEIDRELSNAELEELRQGVYIQTVTTNGKEVNAKTLPCLVKALNSHIPTYQFEITEGRNRQIRRMMETLNRKVLTLHRVAMGPLTLTGISPGKWKTLSKAELQAIQKCH